MKIVDINGARCSFKKISGKGFVRRRKKLGREDYCPLCNKKFEEETTTDIYLIINNYKLFPNTFCHAECIDRLPSLQNVASVLSAFYTLYKDMKQELWEKFPAWRER